MLYQLVSLPSSKDFSIKVNLEMKSKILSCDFFIEGDLDQIEFQSQSTSNEFRRELWKETCFEIFFGMKKSTTYQEWNFNERGNYWVCDFSDYRKEQKERPDLNYLDVSLYKKKSSEALFRINLKTEEQFETLGLNAVLKTKKAQYLYWALQHSDSNKADFHHFKNRAIEVPTLLIQ